MWLISTRGACDDVLNSGLGPSLSGQIGQAFPFFVFDRFPRSFFEDGDDNPLYWTMWSGALLFLKVWWLITTGFPLSLTTVTINIVITMPSLSWSSQHCWGKKQKEKLTFVSFFLCFFCPFPLGKSANVDERTWKIQNMFWEKSSTAPKQVLMYLSLVCKCERLGLTNTKRPNLQIQISAMTNTWGPTVNGHLWGMLHAYVGSSIVAITTPTEKMIGHNHFDDPKMSKSLNKSTPWQSGQVTN